MPKKRKRADDLLQEKKRAVENIEAAEETLDLDALRRAANQRKQENV